MIKRIKLPKTKLPKTLINDEFKEAISFIYSYAPNISEWKILKRELLKILSSDFRHFFSTRDSKTKKQNFNDFERSVVEYWKIFTGTELLVNL